MNTLATFFNLGGPDLIIILVIVLVLFGAKKLPELARGLGQAVKEFSKAKEEFENEITRPPVVEPPRHLDEPKVEVTKVEEEKAAAPQGTHHV